MAKEFRYEIKERIAVLSENDKISTEINLISFNGAEPKYDIRKWDKTKGTMLKGVVLNKEEATQLTIALIEHGFLMEG